LEKENSEAMESAERFSELLQEISDSQKKLLEQNEESLQLQKQQLQLLVRLLDRPVDETEWDSGRLARRGNAMMDRSRTLFIIILFLLVVLLIFSSWALFAR
jgi:ABC-type phosphate transport system auxiliary subunit